jgi:hypothetical protein
MCQRAEVPGIVGTSSRAAVFPTSWRARTTDFRLRIILIFLRAFAERE